jgi:hypothetical protein
VAIAAGRAVLVRKKSKPHVEAACHIVRDASARAK